MTLEPRPIIQSHDPTLYELRGENVCITYSTSSINGQPQFSYQGPEIEENTRTFTGEAIRTQSSELGTLVSVTLIESVDAQRIRVTLLLPTIHLIGQETEQSFKTLAIVTETFGILPHPGAQPTYHGIHLHGTAKLAVF
jgi:hypothetical protein